jgi:hypothetical protein
MIAPRQIAALFFKVRELYRILRLDQSRLSKLEEQSEPESNGTMPEHLAGS